jgi:hypothetical protein
MGTMRATRIVAGVAGGVAASVGLTVLTYPRWRPWCITWGATPEEACVALPGDDLLEDPDLVTTRAISIGVPPQSIWPWIVQMGPGRAGPTHTTGSKTCSDSTCTVPISFSPSSRS